MDTARVAWYWDDHLYGMPLFPGRPLSWMAPFLYLICGAAASGAWTWTGTSVLRLLLGFLLAGPLLGAAWAGALQLHERRLTESGSDSVAPDTILALPYTLPGSPGHRLATRLARTADWAKLPARQRPVVQLLASGLFSLVLAAHLAGACLTVVTLGLAVLCAVVGTARRPTPSWLKIGLPLVLAWLVGHASFAPLRAPSILGAVCFALTFSASDHVARTGKGVQAQTASHATAAVLLVAIKQPLPAAAIALLATAQLLLAPLLEAPDGCSKYFASLQLPLAASLLLTAMALGA